MGEDRRFLIEVLLRARDNFSQVAQKAVKSLDNVTEAQKRNDTASREAAEGSRRQITALEQLREARIREKRAADQSHGEALREATALRDLARARQDQVGAIDKTVKQLTSQADASRKIADQNQRLSRSYSRSISDIERDIGRLASSGSQGERSTNRFRRALDEMSASSNNAKSGLRGLNAEFQGFQIAIAIKYAQSLISALISLGAELVSVAAAAGQAAVGIGAALAAGAAQAVPVVGLLAASFARLTSVLKVVKLQNQQQLTATHDSARAAKAQQTATDQIRSAEERVAEAHRNTARAVTDLARTRSDAARQETDAQRAVNQARKEAIRTVEDLMAAEEDASQSLLRAQLSRDQAITTGDVVGAVQGEIDVSRAQRDVRRTREDAAPARARGVEGIQAVQDAEQRLSDTRRQGAQQIQQAEERLGDARRAEVQSTDDLSRTRREARDNLAQETAAVDKLADSLRQLSPAERQLYRRILELQNTYKRIARPITDIITRAFTGVVERVNAILQDPRIVRGFRGIAVQIAASIRTATREAGGGQSIGAFQILSAEATRNIPIATRILVNFFRAARNLVLDAIPAFRLLLRYVEDYSAQALDASRNSTGIRDFFISGVRYARSFFELGLAVVRLLLTIAGRGGAAAEGIRSIDEMTDAIDGLTRKARANTGAIQNFFRDAHGAAKAVLSVLVNIGIVMAQAFSGQSVQTFADFLNRIIVPALGNALRIMGFMVSAFHQIFSLPGISQVAQMAATVLILARGFTVIRIAMASIGAIIPNFLRAMGLMEAELVGIGAITTGGWVALGVMAAVAAIILLDKQLHFLAPTWRFIKRAADAAWEGIQAGAQAVISWFSDVWTQGLLYWIRWPFVKAFEFLRDHGVFRWITSAAGDMIDWFFGHFGPGGRFALLGDLISLPFRVARSAIHIAFITIRTIVAGALDLISGRFDDFGDTMSAFWSDFVDIGRGAVSSLLDIVGDLLGALGEIPKIGGPFKAAAGAVRQAQDSIDNMRESDRKARDERKRSDKAVKDSIPDLIRLKNRYEDAKDRLDKLTPGTREYRRAVINAHNASKDYNDRLRDTANRAGDARQPVRKLRGNIQSLGDTSADTANAIASDLNAVLEEVGAKKINVRIRRASRRSSAQNLVDSDNPLLGASPFPARYMGGMASPYGGSARDDHTLFDPYGRPVAALSGTEGIVNAPQMGIIDSALGFSQAMGAMPWGSLSDLWGSGMRHYQGGGGLKPAIRNLSTRLDKMFGLVTTSTTGGGHAANSYHYRGLAADISGTPQAMARASRYIRSSGVWRRLLEGIHNPGLSVKNGQNVPPSFWGANTWADHMDHIHLAIQQAVGAIGGATGRVRTPRMSGLGDDAISRIARGGARTLTRAANRYLQRQMATTGGGDARAMGADANVVAAFRRAIRTTGATAKERLALWEAGIVESGLKNLNFGDADSLGSLQERASIYGRGHALNPFASATRFLRDARGLRPWRGSAGMLAAAVQRPAAQFRGRYDQVRGQAMRYMQTGGPLATQRRITPTGIRGLTPMVASVVAPVLDRINGLIDDVAIVLESVTRRALRRSKNLTTRIERAFARITGEGGLLDQVRAQVELVSTRAALRLQQRQFRVTAAGPRRTPMTDADTALAELGGLQEQRGALTGERGTIRGSITAAQRALSEARRRHNRKAEAAAQAALNNLQERLQANSEALAQNAQDQVEAQERFQEGLLTAVNNAADRQNSAIDRWSRVAKALGQRLDPNAVLGAQIQNMQAQIAGLAGVLDQARRTGNADLANRVSDQMAELSVQIAEAAAQQFQNAIDAVNSEAQRQTTRLDRQTRLTQLGGRTDFATLGNLLQQRGGVLTGQRAGLLGLLAQAQAGGNVEQIDSLVDQIDELNVQLAENTQAVQDNTDAAFNFTTQLINQAAEFQQGVFGGAQSFFQAFTARTGIDTSAQQTTALQGVIASLVNQQQGLLGQLGALVGQNVGGLSGQDLVNYLVSISSGPAFDAIMAGLDPTQQDAFRDLVSSLISNATAVEQNTDALDDLNGSIGQSFSTSMWTNLRHAIFTGAGQLLPQYSMMIPSADVGAKVLKSGAIMVHAGETVRPATVQSGGYGGDNYTLNVTTPTQVLDPTDVNRQLAFLRKTGGR